MAWLSGWSIRYALTVTENSGSSLSDHQVELNLQGNDSGAAYYIDFDQYNSDGSDFRITQSDETTEEYYWKVSWDSVAKTAQIFFKASSLTASSNTTFYIYGANSNASSTSSYANTMTKIPDDMSDAICILHCDEGSGQLTDSSGNGQDTNVNTFQWRGSDGGGFQGDETYSFTGDCLQAVTGGTVEQAEIPYDPIWQTITSAGSIGFTIKFSSNGTKETIIKVGGINRFATFEIIRLENKKLRITWGNLVGTYGYVYSASTLNDDTWYDVVVAWNGLDIDIYLNSVLDNSGSMPVYMTHNGDDVTIGNNNQGWNLKDAYLDEIFVAARDLGADEIGDIHERRRYASTQPSVVVGALENVYDIWVDENASTSGSFVDAAAASGNHYAMSEASGSWNNSEESTSGSFVDQSGASGLWKDMTNKSDGVN